MRGKCQLRLSCWHCTPRAPMPLNPMRNAAMEKMAMRIPCSIEVIPIPYAFIIPYITIQVKQKMSWAKCSTRTSYSAHCLLCCLLSAHIILVYVLIPVHIILRRLITRFFNLVKHITVHKFKSIVHIPCDFGS